MGKDLAQVKALAVVTGASSGIGFAVAHNLARQGFELVLAGRRSTALESLQASLAGEYGTNTRLVIADLGLPSGVEKLAAAVSEDGRIPRVGVVSAGRGLRGTVLSSDDSDWQTMFDINVIGALRQMRFLAEAMRQPVSSEPRVSQDIVVVGSNVGRHISPTNSVYGASKFAVAAATESLRRELAADGIRVTLIEPGLVRTAFQDNAGYDPEWFEQYADSVGPILEPGNVANVVEFAISQPPHVHLDTISIRPTRQDYP